MSSLVRRSLLALTVLALAASPSLAARLLIIDSIEVRKTKDDGKSSWDSLKGLPDLIVSIERVSKPAGEKHITAPKKDVLKADLNRSAMDVDAGDELEIIVSDEDVGADDLVGKITRKLTADEIKSGKLELSFGQVRSLILKFDR